MKLTIEQQLAVQSLNFATRYEAKTDDELRWKMAQIAHWTGQTIALGLNGATFGERFVVAGIVPISTTR